jgi:hypothetical protein
MFMASGKERKISVDIRPDSESFGFATTGGAMRRPTRLAYADKVLSVLDGAQGQILRFRLSTVGPRKAPSSTFLDFPSQKLYNRI